MPVTTGRFGVNQDTGDVTEYVPPYVVVIGNVTIPPEPPDPTQAQQEHKSDD